MSEIKTDEMVGYAVFNSDGIMCTDVWKTKQQALNQYFGNKEGPHFSHDYEVREVWMRQVQ